MRSAKIQVSLMLGALCLALVFCLYPSTQSGRQGCVLSSPCDFSNSSQTDLMVVEVYDEKPLGSFSAQFTVRVKVPRCGRNLQLSELQVIPSWTGDVYRFSDE